MLALRPVTALAAMLLFLTGAAPAAAQDAPASSSFAQLRGERGCLAQAPYAFPAELEGCADARGLLLAEAVAVAPDAGHVYVAAAGGPRSGSNAVSAFARDGSTGALTAVNCVSDDGGDGRPGTDGACANGDGLLGVRDVVVSPDGKHVYATSAVSNGLAWFDRDDETGALTQLGCFKEFPRRDRCQEAVGLLGAGAVVASADGHHLYVASGRSDAVAVFARDPDTGALTQVECVSANGTDGLCADGYALHGASALALSPDGSTLYVTAAEFGALAIFTRDADSGRLTQQGCFLAAEVPGGACRRALALDGAGTIAVSADGRDVYVGAPAAGAIAIFRRESDARLEQAGCVEHAPPSGEDELEEDEEEGDEDEDGEEGDDEEEEEEEEEEEDEDRACGEARALSSVREIAGTADGRGLVAAGSGALAAFERDPETGALRQTGCAEEYRTYKSCVEGRGLWGASGVAVTPDGRSLYVTSRTSNAVAVFGAAVAVASRQARATRSGTVRVRLACPRARHRGCVGAARLGRVTDPQARRGQKRARAAAAPATRYRIASGRRATVRLRVPARVQRSLRRHGRLRLQVTARDATRLTRATVRRLTVRGAR